MQYIGLRTGIRGSPSITYVLRILIPKRTKKWQAKRAVGQKARTGKMATKITTPEILCPIGIIAKYNKTATEKYSPHLTA